MLPLQAFDRARCWPFEGLSDELAHDLFDPQWEVRHGAAAALREILRLHGKGAGKCMGIVSTKLLYANLFAWKPTSHRRL